MGWLYGWNSKKELIAHITKGWTGDNASCTTVASCVRGNVLWAVMETTRDGRADRWIMCCLLGAHQGDWGYKDMEESMGPCEYSCPLGYLDMAPEASPEWRAKVRAYAAKRAIKIRVGDTVTLLPGVTPNVMKIVSVTPLQGLASTGVYRLSRRLIASVEAKQTN